MLPDELAMVVQNVTQPDRLGDLIAATLPALTTQAKQELLETPDVKARLAHLVAVLTKEAEVLALGSKIQSQVESEVGKSQREYYLREQMKAIQKELGESDERTQEIDELREKIEAAGMPEEAQEGGPARARPPAQDAARRGRVHGGPDLPRLAGRAAVEQADRRTTSTSRRRGECWTRITRASRR